MKTCNFNIAESYYNEDLRWHLQSRKAYYGEFTKKQCDKASKIFKSDHTHDEASDNYINYLLELAFKIILIFKNLKNEYEYFVVKSNCMVVFADMYPKLQVLSRKLPSVCNRQNKSVLRDPCYYPNSDHLLSSVGGLPNVFGKTTLKLKKTVSLYIHLNQQSS